MIAKLRALLIVIGICSLGGLLSGCQLLGGARVDPVASSVQAPSNVAVYVAVTEEDQPVVSLTPDNFRVYEDDRLLDAQQTHLVLLDDDPVATHHTLVLVDLSGGLPAADRTALADGVRNLIAALRPEQSVTVYAFDGRPEPVLVGDFAQGSEPLAPDLSIIRDFASQDPSRDLHDAVVAGLRELDARLMQSQKPVRRGTLVVFTQGPDLAGRMGSDQLGAIIRHSRHDFVAIGLKSDSTDTLQRIGGKQVVRSDTIPSLPIAFQEAAQRVRAMHQRFYLVSYCSPARSGVRRLRLEVYYKNREGHGRKSSTVLDFDATGFGPGCDARQLPSFVKSAWLPGHTPARPAAPPAQQAGVTSPSAAPIPAPASAPTGETEVPPTAPPSETAPKPPSSTEPLPAAPPAATPPTATPPTTTPPATAPATPAPSSSAPPTAGSSENPG